MRKNSYLCPEFMIIRPSTYRDLDALEAIFASARCRMVADGNPNQWSDGYPGRAQLADDVERGVSYVVEHEGRVCGSFVFVIGADPTYDVIDDGRWLDDVSEYGTIHRIASDGSERGIFRMVLAWCSARCGNIRIDTHADNQRMIHLIEKAGFTRCGIIYTRNRSARIAYQVLEARG